MIRLKNLEKTYRTDEVETTGDPRHEPGGS